MTADAEAKAISPYDFKELLFVENPFDTIELDGLESEGVEVDIQGCPMNQF